MDIELIKSLFDELIYSPNSDDIIRYTLEWVKINKSSLLIDCVIIHLTFNCFDDFSYYEDIDTLFKMLGLEFYIVFNRV